jgi:hypothetical protein
MRLILSLVAVLSVTLIACDDGPTGGGSGKPALIAGWEYVNFAWGFRQEYYFIDDRGTLWLKSPTEAESLFVLDSLDWYSQADISRYLEGADSIQGMVSVSDLKELQEHARDIACSRISECTSSGNDMGTVQTFLFVRQRPPMLYRRVLLCQIGDWSCHNEHPAAAELDTIIWKYELCHQDNPAR